MARLAWLPAIILGLGCADEPSSPSDPAPGPANPGGPGSPGDDPDDPVPPPPPANSDCSGIASYRITMDMSWDPVGVPNPHWSPLVGATHNSELELWSVGGIATDGIESMAETGATSALVAEIDEAVEAGTSDGAVVGGPIALSPGSSSIEIDVSSEFALVTLVSMLAPSPDWFVGVNGLALCEDGIWIEGSFDLVVYDAGTDSGASFTSGNMDTVPRQPIALDSGFAGNVVGSLSFELTE
jgi:hypothetical protein